MEQKGPCLCGIDGEKECDWFLKGQTEGWWVISPPLAKHACLSEMNQHLRLHIMQMTVTVWHLVVSCQSLDSFPLLSETSESKHAPSPSLASLSLWRTAFSKPEAQSLSCVAVAVSPCKVVSSKLPDLEIAFTKTRTEVPVTVVDHMEKLSRKSRSLNYAGLIPGSGRSPGEGQGSPLRCSCLENPVDRGTWWATVHGVAKSCTWLRVCMCVHTHTQTTFRKILQMFQCQWVRIKLLPKGSYFLICSWKSNSGQWWNNCDVSSSFSPPLKRPCLNLGKGKLTVTDLPSHKYSKRELIWLSHNTTPPPTKSQCKTRRHMLEL